MHALLLLSLSYHKIMAVINYSPIYMSIVYVLGDGGLAHLVRIGFRLISDSTFPPSVPSISCLESKHIRSRHVALNEAINASFQHTNPSSDALDGI